MNNGEYFINGKESPFGVAEMTFRGAFERESIAIYDNSFHLRPLTGSGVPPAPLKPLKTTSMEHKK